MEIQNNFLWNINIYLKVRHINPFNTEEIVEIIKKKIASNSIDLREANAGAWNQNDTL